MLPIRLEKEKVDYLLNAAKNQPYELTVDLENETISDNQGFSSPFVVTDYWKKMLINGWDEIEITLQLDEEISKYEKHQDETVAK